METIEIYSQQEMSLLVEYRMPNVKLLDICKITLDDGRDCLVLHLPKLKFVVLTCAGKGDAGCGEELTTLALFNFENTDGINRSGKAFGSSGFLRSLSGSRGFAFLTDDTLLCMVET